MSLVSWFLSRSHALRARLYIRSDPAQDGYAKRSDELRSWKQMQDMELYINNPKWSTTCDLHALSDATMRPISFLI